ncbi:MAG: hypothetical protein ACP5OR_04230 [Candidatus Dormibacteria bacterium]
MANRTLFGHIAAHDTPEHVFKVLKDRLREANLDHLVLSASVSKYHIVTVVVDPKNQEVITKWLEAQPEIGDVVDATLLQPGEGSKEGLGL